MRKVHAVWAVCTAAVACGVWFAPLVAQQPAGATYQPTQVPVSRFAPINVAAAARQQALSPLPERSEIEDIEAPGVAPRLRWGVPILPLGQLLPQAPPPSPTGPSPGPSRTFQGEFLSGATIPPDTMGAVGTTHVLTVTNDRMRIQTRDGAELARMTMTSFWTGVTIKGAAVSAFDTKVYFDRFNSRFIITSSANAQTVNSGVLFGVSQTADPTGSWNRYSVAADPASTAAGGHWIDYPTVGFNKDWIVVDENVFNFGTAGGGYYGTQIYVLDKAAAYANTLSSISLFEAAFSGCTAPFETKLACGFTIGPAITEDNTTATEYLVEDWDSTFGQLRLSKITGTAAAPVLTVGTQFPQSPYSWQFSAARITTSGGYAPQRQQSAHLTSGSRIMTNDSRIQNAVLRNGSLWTTHTVMLATTPTPAGSGYDTSNPDNHSAIQWWQIDPTVETGLAAAPLQRARIEDPTANNCHNGAGGILATPPCNGSTLNQVGEFFAFPNISVNVTNDVLIGFTQFSNLTYASSAYAVRIHTDAANTTRDPAVFRAGQANYNIGSGSGTARQDRWGDYSAAHTDPLNDTDFWVIQEYAGAQRNFGIGIAGPWETWWALVKPGTAAPTTSGTLWISEFRLRGPQGVNDEFVELFNPGASALIVNTTDNSDGWALAYSTTGGAVSAIAVIPNGTIIPAKGRFLVARNQDAANDPTLVYSLNAYPAGVVRAADSDLGYAVDNADNGGLAIFKTSTVANFSALTRMDSVGFAGVPVGLFKEGTGLPDLPTTNLQEAVVRRLPGGCIGSLSGNCSSVALVQTSPGPSSTTPVDTDNNAADFIVMTADGTDLGAAGRRLGAPGPENLDGPAAASDGSGLTDAKVDSCSASFSAPNFVRDLTPVANGTLGTLDIRRTFTNNTGGNITRLRFRIVDMTTLPSLAGVADLRPLSSTDIAPIVDRPPCGSGSGAVTVHRTLLEQPPTQALGGGYNSSLSVDAVTTAAPLAPAGTIDVRFLIGVEQAGAARVCVVAESWPATSTRPLCFFGDTTSTGTGFTDSPFTVGVTLIKAVHVRELRGRIDAQRGRFGLAAYSWSDPVLTEGVTVVKLQHILELRIALSEAYTASGRPSPMYSSPTAVVRAIDFTELQGFVSDLE